MSGDDYGKAALAAWTTSAPKRAANPKDLKQGIYIEPLVDSEAKSFALNMNNVVYYCIESSNEEDTSERSVSESPHASDKTMSSVGELVVEEEDEEEDASESTPPEETRKTSVGFAAAAIPEGVPKKAVGFAAAAEPEPGTQTIIIICLYTHAGD